MNIEIANRLCAYRKHHGLSQEELAEKIGVSRQAVSKWERVETSPDTDNLILLSQIYGVTLDDLLYKDPVSENTEDGKSHVSFKAGLHINTSDDHLHISWGDDDEDDDDEDDDDDDKDELLKPPAGWYRVWRKIPWALLCCIGYLLLGFLVPGAWGWGWLLFLTIPIYSSLGKAIDRRNPRRFAYPVLVVLVYLASGLFYSLWHPGWLLFLTVPVYYSVCSIFKKK